jgi:S1-C subfamily serine protease
MLNEHGFALTAAHLFEVKTCVKTMILVKAGSSPEELRAELMNLDSERDLALIKLPAGNYTPVKLSRGTIKIGEELAAFGFPINQNSAVATGTVVATANGPEGQIIVNSRLSPGLSGGPVFDRHGEVTGIAIGNIGPDPRTPGGIVVPIEFAKPLTESAGITLIH